MTFTEQQAKQKLRDLIQKYHALSPEVRKTLSETDVVAQFVSVLLEEVLGWPIKQPGRFRYEQVMQAGRPDMILTPERGGSVYVEAKRFEKIKELPEARRLESGLIKPNQLPQSGIDVARTAEEQQAINYAFTDGGTWAILTNFEKLRLFNARRDWLVLSFERPGAYLDEFDSLMQLSYDNILNGSLESLSNQRFTVEVDSHYLQFINEWRERLAQDIIERRNENPWAFNEQGEVDLLALRNVVQRVIDRLVVMRFAEDHYVIEAGTVRSLQEFGQRNRYADIGSALTMSFRGFDRDHNSALFAPDRADQASFSRNIIIELVGKLYEARYRSLPADIMGNTYEQYLGKTLVRRNGSIATADNLETRKKQGSYYTPQVIVRYIVDNSLGRYLYGTENGQPDGTPIPGENRKTAADIRNLRVLDSACGSGSFLIYAYQVLDQFYEAEKERYSHERQQRYDALVAQGTIDPMELQIQLAGYKAELDRIHNHQRLILETHLYGVDLDPQAAEIAVVNLMMRGMAGMASNVREDKRLPLILNQNVKVGNSLIGLRPDDPRMAEHAADIARLIQLRADLINTPHDSPKHDQIIRDMQSSSAALNEALNVHFAEHFTDLTAVRPFHWGAEFPEVFFDKDGNPLDNAGFTIVVGNPPWEILKPDLREYYAQFDENIESRLNRQQVEARIAELDTEDPRRRDTFNANVKMVEQTSTYVRRTDDYQRQGRGDLATHKLFLERMYMLLRHEGRIGYVVPSGIYTDLGTKELREMLLNEGNIQYIFSFSNERFFFPGLDHRFKFTMLSAEKGIQADGFWSVFRFNPRVAVKPDELPEFLADRNKLIYVQRKTLEKFSPTSLSVMEFQSPIDYEIANKIFNSWPLLGNEVWSISISTEIHATNNRDLLNTNRIGFPLYEGATIHQYNAYYGKYEFWVDETRAKSRFARANATNAINEENTPLTYQVPRVAYREITNSTNERTLIAAFVPGNVFCNHKLYVVRTGNSQQDFYVLALMNSMLIDFIMRFRAGTSISTYMVKQLPFPCLNPGDKYFDAIVPRAARLTCTRQEFAELWQQVMGGAWDESKGATSPAERQQLRDEIDAIVAHLYGLSREDFDHILGTFPLVFPDNAEGKAKRQRLLGVYDAWAGKV